MNESYIYCLEYVKDRDKPNHSPMHPWLEQLAWEYGITSVHQVFDDLESFEFNLQNLFYEDRHYNDYVLIYLVVEGQGATLKIGDYFYSLEELAELFEGKLKHKILHFANTFTLDLNSEQIQYFIDLTRADGVSGYSQRIPILSSVLDTSYFQLVQEQDDVIQITEDLYEKNPLLARQLGFTMHYL